MAFSNQFTLSLEITNLIPLALTAAGKTYEAAMKLARDLQNSGSDFVIEDDLAEIFGRNRISRSTESSFRTVVSKVDPPVQLTDRITLRQGAGPTVSRALAFPHEAYLATVIQCSMLLSVHEKYSLATAIAQYFEIQAQEAAQGGVFKEVPSIQRLRGILQTIEDQTCDYDWHRLLLSIEMLLGLPGSAMHETIPGVILRGLIGMLPMVQRFPEDRYIIIKAARGICPIVLWAHHVLGLSVLVRQTNKDGTSTDQLFGPAPEQIFISGPENSSNAENKQPSITLLSTSNKEPLFENSQEEDEEIIDATLKGPVRGYAKRVFEMAMPFYEPQFEELRKRMVLELASITYAFAICISQRLAVADPHRREEVETDFQLPAGYEGIGAENSAGRVGTEDSIEATSMGNKVTLKHEISERRIFAATSILFDNPKMNTMTAKEYAKRYSGSGLDEIWRPPKVIQDILEDKLWRDEPEQNWIKFRRTAISLSTIILAFANVTNLEASVNLPISQHVQNVSLSNLSLQLQYWDGEKNLEIRDNVWFEIIVLLMIGHREVALGENVCLVCDRGWSVFVSTFGAADPYYVGHGQITVRPGVPCRNEIRKHKIVDGPLHGTSGKVQNFREAGAREPTTMNCSTAVDFVSPYTGEDGDNFVVVLRIRSLLADRNAVDQKRVFKRTGYRSLFRSIWTCQKTAPCEHHPESSREMILEPGVFAVNAEDADLCLGSDQIRIIYLTASNSAARWQALVNILLRGHHDLDFSTFRPAMIRGPDCCFRCAVDQMMKRNGPWCLVL